MRHCSLSLASELWTTGSSSDPLWTRGMTVATINCFTAVLFCFVFLLLLNMDLKNINLFFLKRKNTERNAISPSSHQRELLSWSAIWGEVLPVLQRAKEGCRCRGIYMFSSILKMQREYTFMKPDYPSNTQSMYVYDSPVLCLYFIAVLLPGSFPWWSPGLHHQPTHPPEANEVDPGSKRVVHTHLGRGPTISGCMYVQWGSKESNDQTHMNNLPHDDSHHERGLLDVRMTYGEWQKGALWTFSCEPVKVCSHFSPEHIVCVF